MTTAQSFIVDRKSKFAQFWTLIKPLQTGLLLATGVAGYMSAHGTVDIPILFISSALPGRTWLLQQIMLPKYMASNYQTFHSQ